MIEVEEARRLLLAEAPPLGPVEVELGQALGHVLAEEIRADQDLPPADRSTMDGFAVRVADVSSRGNVLEVHGEVRAGEPVGDAKLNRGEAVRIFTGAIVPSGADAVVMVELTREGPASGTVEILEQPTYGQNIRRRGEDVRQGDPILEQGAPIHAAEIAALATVGKTRVRVIRPPVVHVLSTGDEVVEPDTTPLAHQVRNSNARALLAQLGEMGLAGRYLGIAPDVREPLDRAIAEGLSADVLLITGGVSAGEYDLVGEALTRSGMRLLFHKVAVRPGKPILAGRRGECLVVGLPGNPVSTFTGFAVFVAPVLRRMMGFLRLVDPEVRAVLAERLPRRPGRTTYHLARVEVESGRFVAHPVKTMGSADVISLVRANAFIVTAGAADALEAGVEVSAILWKDAHLR